MACIPFHSREKQHKAVLGAVAEGQNFKLRLLLPRAMQCSCAKLVIHKDGDGNTTQGMFWAGMQWEDHEWWEIDFCQEQAGLYWYHFELDTPWGVNAVTQKGGGVGKFGFDGSDFQQMVYEKGFQTPQWLQGGLIYQIFPDRFCASGEPKEGVPEDRVLRSDWGGQPEWKPDEQGIVRNHDFFGGDLKGIVKKLDYLQRLGVSCLYLNPIFESQSNHRYDTADYMKIDPLLGKEEDLRDLCRQAAQRGISVVLDGVFSHTGCDSVYFNKFARYGEGGAYHTRQSPYFPWYKFEQWPNRYRSWWGIDTLPEIMEENASFRDFICGKEGVLRHWMRCGVRGWRLDVADELPDCFLDDLRRCVKEENAEAVIIGEVWEDATNKISYGVRRRYLQGRQLDSVMNYPFAQAILRFVRDGSPAEFMDQVMAVVEHYPPQVLHILMNHIGTHDTQRALTALAGEPGEDKDRRWQSTHGMDAEQVQQGLARLKLAAVLQYTLPGVPSLYYGDEAGMQGYRDPFNRGCYPWGKENRALLRWYEHLGRVRKGCGAFRDGDFEPLYAFDDVVAYQRKNERNQVFVAVNRSEMQRVIPVDLDWSHAYPLFGALPVAGELVLPPYGYCLLSR